MCKTVLTATVFLVCVAALSGRSFAAERTAAAYMEELTKMPPEFEEEYRKTREAYLARFAPELREKAVAVVEERPEAIRWRMGMAIKTADAERMGKHYARTRQDALAYMKAVCGASSDTPVLYALMQPLVPGYPSTIEDVLRALEKEPGGGAAAYGCEIRRLGGEYRGFIRKESALFLPERPGGEVAALVVRVDREGTIRLAPVVVPPLAAFFPEYPGVRLAEPAGLSRKNGPAPKRGVDPDGTLFLPFATLTPRAEVVDGGGEFVVRVRLTEPSTPLNRGKEKCVSDVAFRYTFDPEAGRYVGEREE